MKLAIALLFLVVIATCDDTAVTADPTAGATPAAATTTADPAATTTTADPTATTTTATPTATTTAADPTATTTAAPNPTTATSQYTYDLIPMADYDKYPLIPSLRDMGIQLVLAAALKNGHITSTEIVLQTTNSIEHRIGSQNNEFYRFNCSLANGNNKTQTVVAYFVARHNTVTNEDAIPYWYYLAHMFWITNPTTSVVETNQTAPEPPVEEEEAVEEVVEEEVVEEEAAPAVTTPVISTTNDTILYPWVLLPAADYGSDFNTDNANFGMNYFVSHEVPKGNITNGTYSVKLIDEVWKQTLPNVTNYRYITQIDKLEDSYIYNVTFGLLYPTATNKRSMGFYRFQTLDANGNPVGGTGTLPTLNPLKSASETVTTTTVDGNPVSTTSGGITVDP